MLILTGVYITEVGEHLPEQGSSSSCDNFGPAASEKYIWRLQFQQKLPIGNQQIKRKRREKCEKFINPWTNYWWINELFCR